MNERGGCAKGWVMMESGSGMTVSVGSICVPYLRTPLTILARPGLSHSLGLPRIFLFESAFALSSSPSH